MSVSSSKKMARGLVVKGLSSPDLREDALDDMMHRIHLQSDDPDFLVEAERDQL